MIVFSSDQIILDAMYDTRTAGLLMGGLHPNDVNLLIKKGVIGARIRNVRGLKGRGRTVIPGAEIKRFNESLPLKGEDGKALETMPPPIVRRTRRPPKVKLQRGPSW